MASAMAAGGYTAVGHDAYHCGRRALLVLWAALLGVLIPWSPLFVPRYASGGEPQFVSIRDGHWSDPNTWQPKRVPDAYASVVIARGTRVEYDAASDREIASMTIEGTLEFSH